MRLQVSGFKFQVVRITLFAVYCLLLTLFCGCGKKVEEAAGEPGKLSVYTVNYPLQYFAERIGCELVDVQCPAPRDEDPAYWSPSFEVVTAYQQADVILLNGADYAKWLSKVSLPSSKLVDTSETFRDRLIHIEEQSTHSHGPEGKHAHGRLAFTTWLDLTLAIEQARAVKDALAAELPEEATIFDDRFAALERELLGIDKLLKDVFSADPMRPLVFSHPVYQYLERRYEVSGMSVHWEPGEVPTDDMLAELKELLLEHQAKWMVWEGEPLPDAVQLLKGLGMESIVFDPCGNTPDEGDYLTVMQSNVQELRRVFAR